jgi:hypothetical protein
MLNLCSWLCAIVLVCIPAITYLPCRASVKATVLPDVFLRLTREEDPEVPEESDHESDLDEDELDLSLPIPEGSRRSARERTPAKTAGYMLNSQLLHIVMTEDSEA